MRRFLIVHIFQQQAMTKFLVEGNFEFDAFAELFVEDFRPNSAL